MWEGKITDELIEVSKEYGNIFNASPEGYSNVDYDDLTYDEFLALINRSIELRTELPVTIYGLLGDPEFAEE